MTNSPAEIYDKLWDARKYLRQYYATSAVAGDELANIAFARRKFAEAGRIFDSAMRSDAALHSITPCCSLRTSRSSI